MTVISSYSVSLGLDAQNYIKNSALSRSETAKLRRDIEAAKTPVEKYAQTYDLLEKALAKQTISLGTYKRLLDEARSKVEQFNAKVQESVKAVEIKTTKLGVMAGAFRKVGETLGPINSLLATYLGFSTAKKAFTLATDAEDAAIAFEVMTGSASESLRLMQELRTFSDRSPITFGGAQQAARTLLSFNVAAKDVIPTVKMMGDAVGGNNERFKMLALAYSQMSAAGRLMGQDLLQMINAGFNPLQTISRITGESMLELKKRMEEGGISAQEVANAFRVATSAGGRFYGMTERLSQTMSGKLNLAMSDLEKAGVRLGNTIGPMMVDFAKGMAEAAEKAGPLLAVIQKISDGIRVIMAFGGDAGNLVSGLANSVMTGEQMKGDAAASLNKLFDDFAKRERDKVNAEREQQRQANQQQQRGFIQQQQQRQPRPTQQQREPRPQQQQRPMPPQNQQELLAEAKKQVMELKAANARQQQMIAAMNRVADKVGENGFRRYR